MFMAGYFDNHDGEIKVSASSNELKGENYENVIERLEDMGFYNIETESFRRSCSWLVRQGKRCQGNHY